MFFRIFSLYPQIFEGFLSSSLIARGISKEIIKLELINWREKFGVGNYKQIDDRPFGGGTGMVLMVEPIYQALLEFQAISQLFNPLAEISSHQKILPNNSLFEEKLKSGLIKNRQVTISLTPRGYPLTQATVEWLSKEFDQINILCGRFEGFDARVSEMVDLELSVGNFVTNGGESPCMCLVEAVARLLPDFVTKNQSVLHDSFSSELNSYSEQKEFVIGAKKIKQKLSSKLINKEILTKPEVKKLFNDEIWLKNILPQIEHPQYTRPSIWQNLQVPKLLQQGNHKLIQDWRHNWWKNSS